MYKLFPKKKRPTYSTLALNAAEGSLLKFMWKATELANTVKEGSIAIAALTKSLKQVNN